MYKKILVPVDLSHPEVASKILKIAALLADDNALVTALHVVPEVPAYAMAYVPDHLVEDRTAEIRASLDGLVAEAGVTNAEVLIVGGAAHMQILDHIEAAEPDLVIIGSHRPGLSDYFLGSTAARVVRHAACSVLVDR